jgi:hypothetical protein
LRRYSGTTRQKTPLSKFNSVPDQGHAEELQWDHYSRVLPPTEWGPTVILRGNNPHDRMPALGRERTSVRVGIMSAPLKF